MEETYKRLGFKKPDVLENPYGIRIYVGTKDKDDWCVEVPKELCKLKSASTKYYNFYLVTEKRALEIAEKYTELAKQYKR